MTTSQIANLKAGTNLPRTDTAARMAEALNWPRLLEIARALATHGDAADLKDAIEVLRTHASLAKNDVFTSLLALSAIDALGKKAAPLRDEIAAQPKRETGVPGRMQTYVPRLLEHIAEQLQ